MLDAEDDDKVADDKVADGYELFDIAAVPDVYHVCDTGDDY